LLGYGAESHGYENKNVDTAARRQTLIIQSVVCCFTA